MRLHLLGIPHTLAHPRFSHCAFTNKTRTFAAMLAEGGFADQYEVIHYGAGWGDEVLIPHARHVSVMSSSEQALLLGHTHDDPTRLVGEDANCDTPLYRAFNKQLGTILRTTVADGDLILLPLGPAHAQALEELKERLRPEVRWLAVESGIGYPNPYVAARAYESSAWMHLIAGRQGHEGSDYHTVIPPWVLPSEWPLVDALPNQKRFGFLFLGRQVDIKGAQVVAEIAQRRPHIEFLCAGQGTHDLHKLPNVTMRGAISGARRAQLLGSVKAVLCPSQFVEPGCQVSMEARAMGTPVIAPPRGVFLETLSPPFDSHFAASLSQWLDAVDEIEEGGPRSDPLDIRMKALDQHSPKVVAPLYHRFLQHSATLMGRGWYTLPEQTSLPLTVSRT